MSQNNFRQGFSACRWFRTGQYTYEKSHGAGPAQALVRPQKRISSPPVKVMLF